VRSVAVRAAAHCAHLPRLARCGSRWGVESGVMWSEAARWSQPLAQPRALDGRGHSMTLLVGLHTKHVRADGKQLRCRF
jgi:hypothetical protein